MSHRSRLRLHSVEGIPNGGVSAENPKGVVMVKLVGCDAFPACGFFQTPVARCV